jgi:hypothetical protein
MRRKRVLLYVVLAVPLAAVAYGAWVVRDAGLARELAQIFEDDIKGCDVMTLEKWRRRPLVSKALQGVVSLLQEQV